MVVRSSSNDRGYDRRWQRISGQFKLAHPLCLGCEAVGRVTATEVVDHVVPHKGDALLFWDQSRWQPACRWHHDLVKQQLELRFAKGALSEADLWLDASAAIALTLREGTATGVDGWPVDGVGGGQNLSG